MRRSDADNQALSESLASAGGLGQFRTVAGGRKHERDDPFGTPAPAKAKARPANTDPVPKARPPKPVSDRPVEAMPEAPEAPPSPDSAPEAPKVSIFTENVTVPLSASLRDRAEELARVLNRNRKVRKERITRNSVIRVALELFLEAFSPRPSDTVNCEEDLLRLMKTSPNKR